MNISGQISGIRMMLVGAAFIASVSSHAVTRNDGTYAANPRVAASPTGSAMCVQLDPSGVVAHYNSDPLTQPWSNGTTLSLAIPAGQEPLSADVTYAGNGRYVAAWVVDIPIPPSQGAVYSAYTDDGISWSAPLKLDVDDDSQTTETGKSEVTIASDGQGTVLVGWIGNWMRMKLARSTDSGASFTVPVLQVNEQGYSPRATKYRLATNGSGTWYEAYTNFHGISVPYPPESSGYVRASMDGGLTWNAGYRFGLMPGYNLVQNVVAMANRAYVLYYLGGLATLESADNGQSWAAELSSSAGKPPYLFNTAELAIDVAGNRVAVYQARMDNFLDLDLLCITSANLQSWDMKFKTVANQINRAENAPAITSLGTGKFLVVTDVADSQSTNTRGIQAKTSSDAGATWSTGVFISGYVPAGTEREYVVPADPAKFVIGAVTPKIKFKEPKPGKPPKPRKAQFKVVIGSTNHLTVPETVEIKMYLSDDDTLQIGQDTLLYTGTTKLIKPGKFGKLNIKFADFPDPAGKYILIQLGNAAPYVLAM